MKDKIIAIAKKNAFVAFLLINFEYYFRWCFGHRDSQIELTIKHYSKIGCPPKLVKDMMYCKYVDGLEHFSDYFMFDFYSKKPSQRRDYVCTTEYKTYFKKLKESITENVFKDKYLAYQTLKDYYKRESIKIEGFEDYPQYLQYVSTHSEFLLKALEGSLGQGISKVIVNPEMDKKKLFFEILQNSPCVLEDYIIQCDELAAFNSHSVNTVRFAMYTHDDGSITDIYAMFRTGVGDTIIDNASMGGIACAVDTETGIVISDGYTKTCGEHFIEHPESHIKYKGFQIPRWDELKQTCYEASKLVPQFKMVGWDMALTDDGWVVIEANSRPNINTIQMCLGHGLRDKIEKTVATM